VSATAKSINPAARDTIKTGRDTLKMERDALKTEVDRLEIADRQDRETPCNRWRRRQEAHGR